MSSQGFSPPIKGGGEPCHYREGECELLNGVGGKAVWIIKGEGV